MKIVWRKAAEQELLQAFDYILEDDIEAAYMVLELIEKRVEQLLLHPNIGRVGRVEGTRELLIAQTPYILPYCVENDTIEILAVLHSSQKWPNEF